MNTRSAPRININLKVISHIDDDSGLKLAFLENGVFEATAVDISTLGVGILTKYFFPKGVHIELQIDGKPFGLDSPMLIKGEIRWCFSMKPQQYRCGVKFTEISKDYLNRINDFIASFERRREPRLKLSD